MIFGNFISAVRKLPEPGCIQNLAAVVLIYYHLLLTLPSSLSKVSGGLIQLPIDQSVTFPENFSFVISSPESFSDPTKDPIRYDQ